MVGYARICVLCKLPIYEFLSRLKLALGIRKLNKEWRWNVYDGWILI
jgi:hypothetical protein